MIIYTQTPDYYDEYLQHGWLKDQAAKVHKYIERWRGKNGKWYYRYAVNKAKQLSGKAKLKAIDLKTKFNRKIKGMSADQISYKNGKRTVERHDDGKAKSTTRPYGNRVYKGKTETYNNGYNQKGYAYMRPETEPGVEAGRERVANKKKTQKQKATQKIYNDQQSNRKRTTELKSKGYKQGNLTNKGYSNSTSGENSSAINKSKIVANQKQKALDKRGYYNSKTDKSYRRKKSSLTQRGYEVGSGSALDYRDRINSRLVKGDDFFPVVDGRMSYWDKRSAKGYIGPRVLSPAGQEFSARRNLNQAGRAGWLSAARKRAGYVNKKRTKK